MQEPFSRVDRSLDPDAFAPVQHVAVLVDNVDIDMLKKPRRYEAQARKLLEQVLAHWARDLGQPLAIAPGHEYRELLAEAARRLVRQSKPVAGATAATALLFLALWIVSEIRRLFHGATLTSGDFGYAEVAAYAAAGVALALSLDIGRGRLSAALDSKSGLGAVVDAVNWTAVAVGLLLLAGVASPWWGPLAGDLHAPLLLGVLYTAACLCGVGLAVIARRSARPMLAQAALAGAGIEGFVLLTLVVRFVFHSAAMRAPLREDSLETWTFSAVWALYGLAALAIGAGRRDMALRSIGLAVLLATTAKVFLFDLGHLEGVVRAASFLALGLVLVVGALAARRFSSAGASPRASDGGQATWVD